MASLQIAPLTPTVGAEVEGVDLRRPLAAEEVRQFGEPCYPPFMTEHGDDPEILVLDQTDARGEGTDVWHSDNTFMAEPPMGSILRAIQLPTQGGDTCFASAYAAYAAYEALSPVLREMLDGMTAVHDLTATLLRAIAGGHTNADLSAMLEKAPPVEHPVVRTHPKTGRKALFVNANSTTRIVGLTERENALLLPFLCDHIRSPEFQCRFRWTPHAIAFWDNRSAQHLAVADYRERRVMHRVTLAGDKPF